MAKYIEKRDPVEAVLWTGENLDETVAFTDESHLMIVINPHVPACTYASYKMMEEAGFHEEIHHLLIGSENVEIYKDQYIIRDINGRYSEMSKDNFEVSYERLK